MVLDPNDERNYTCAVVIYMVTGQKWKGYVYAAAAELFPFTNIALFIATGIRCDSIFLAL
jgi:hypothetical protein